MKKKFSLTICSNNKKFYIQISIFNPAHNHSNYPSAYYIFKKPPLNKNQKQDEVFAEDVNDDDFDDVDMPQASLIIILTMCHLSFLNLQTKKSLKQPLTILCHWKIYKK